MTSAHKAKILSGVPFMHYGRKFFFLRSELVYGHWRYYCRNIKRNTDEFFDFENTDSDYTLMHEDIYDELESILND